VTDIYSGLGIKAKENENQKDICTVSGGEQGVSTWCC